MRISNTGPLAVAGIAAVLFGAATPARAWRTSLAGAGRAHAVAALADGRVVAAGELAGAAEDMFTVAQFEPTTGAELWRAQPGPGGATSIEIDNAGDLLVAGSLGAKGGVGIVKFDDADGSEAWRFRVPNVELGARGRVPAGRAANGDAYLAVTRNVENRDIRKAGVYRLAGSDGSAAWKRSLGRRLVVDLAVDSGGYPIVATSESATAPIKLYKLNRSNGAVLWTQPTDFRADEFAFAVLSNDDLALAGGVAPGGAAELAVLAGIDGAELWRKALGASPGATVRLAPTKDAGLLVSTDDVDTALSSTVARYAAVSGAVAWSTALPGAGGADCGTTALLSGPGNVPIAGGCATIPPADGFRFQVAKLGADTGVRLWTRGIDGTSPDGSAPAGPVLALGSDASGNLVAAGATADGPDAPAFTVVKWNALRGDDLVTAADRACRQAIISAGVNYVFTRLQTLESCRDQVNAGQLEVGFAGCAEVASIATKLGRLATRTRNSIAAACTGPALPPGVSCGATLDELISGDGTSGCLVDIDDAVDEDLMDVAYAAELVGPSSAEKSCQTAIGTAGRRVFGAALGAVVDCRSRGPLSAADCAGDEVLEATIAAAAIGNRSRISSNCPGAVLAAVNSCAATLDGFLSPDGTSGCLVEAARLGAETASEAHD